MSCVHTHTQVGEQAFAPHYPAVLTVLFAALAAPVPPAEIPPLLTANLRLLERHRRWLVPEAVTALLSSAPASPVAALRRHPRRAVAAAAARTYIALLSLPLEAEAAAEAAHVAVMKELEGHLTALVETPQEHVERVESDAAATGEENGILETHLEGALFVLAALSGAAATTASPRAVASPRHLAQRLWRLTAPLSPPVCHHPELQLAAVEAVRVLSTADVTADNAGVAAALPTKELVQRMLCDGVRPWSCGSGGKPNRAWGELPQPNRALLSRGFREAKSYSAGDVTLAEGFADEKWQ